jgi:8-oxo-dGTP pyrophosphatase MutT (NUDIX family)
MQTSQTPSFLNRPSQTGHRFVHLEPPENFLPKIEVAGCFVVVDDYFLFLKQHPNDSEANTWGVPGGKCNKTETPLNCGIREVYEETGVDLKDNPPRLIGKVYIRYPEADFVYWMFEARLKSKPEKIAIDPAERTESRWMTLPEALELPLIRGENECIHLVYNNHLCNLTSE